MTEHIPWYITLLQCIMITEVGFLGSILMLSFPWGFTEGFVIWGCTLLVVCGLFVGFGGMSDFDEKFWLWATIFVNAIGINFGGYLIVMILLRMPIAGVVYP